MVDQSLERGSLVEPLPSRMLFRVVALEHWSVPIAGDLADNRYNICIRIFKTTFK